MTKRFKLGKFGWETEDKNENHGDVSIKFNPKMHNPFNHSMLLDHVFMQLLFTNISEKPHGFTYTYKVCLLRNGVVIENSMEMGDGSCTHIDPMNGQYAYIGKFKKNAIESGDVIETEVSITGFVKRVKTDF